MPYQFVHNPNKKLEQPKLVGKIFDYLGNRLSPTYSYKYSANGRYKMRYYINREISKQGKTASEFKRIRAEYIDNIVSAETDLIIQLLLKGLSASENQQLSSLLLKSLSEAKIDPMKLVSKLVLFPRHMELTLKIIAAENELSENDIQELAQFLKPYKATMSISTESGILIQLNIKASYKKLSGQMHIITENGTKTEYKIDAEYCHPDDKSFAFIAKSFYWNKQVDSGIYSSQKEISAAENQNLEYLKKALVQRFLSPNIINVITSNEKSLQVPVEKLIQCRHWNWKKQEAILLSATQN